MATLFKDGVLYDADDFHEYYATYIRDGYLLGSMTTYEISDSHVISVKNLNIVIGGVVYTTDSTPVGTCDVPTANATFIGYAVVAVLDKIGGEVRLRLAKGNVSSSPDNAIKAISSCATETSYVSEYVLRAFYCGMDGVVHEYTGTQKIGRLLHEADARMKPDIKSFRTKALKDSEKIVSSFTSLRDAHMASMERVGLYSEWIECNTVETDEGRFWSTWNYTQPSSIEKLVYLNGRLIQTPERTQQGDYKVFDIPHGDKDKLVVRHIFKKS